MLRPRRITLCFCALTLGSIAACVGSQTPTATRTSPAYAVLYGHVATSNNFLTVQVFGQAYTDSVNAVTHDSLFGGFNNQVLNDSNNYITFVSSAVPRKVYFNFEAIATRPSGVDSVHAVPVRLDSLGGGPHDSIRVDFTLP